MYTQHVTEASTLSAILDIRVAPFHSRICQYTHLWCIVCLWKKKKVYVSEYEFEVAVNSHYISALLVHFSMFTNVV